MSFYGLQEVGCLGCSFGVCTSVCVDNVRVRPQACESICMCFKVEDLLHVGEDNNKNK